ncbi:hypothetical protein WDU94_002355 [Cyamophila willieti]
MASKFLLASTLLVNLSIAFGIKNGPLVDSTALSGELASAGTLAQSEGSYHSPGHNRDDRLSRPDRNFIITHEGILNYHPAARSLHNLDQDFRASASYSRSEVIPVPNDGSRAASGRALSDNSLVQVQPGSRRDVQAAYTSQDAVSVPLHVGFQVEDVPPGHIFRMNPKGKVLNYEGDISPAASTHQYARKLVARQSQETQLVARQPLGTLSPPQPFRSNADLGVAESSNVPLVAFGQRVESTADPSSSRQITKLHSIHHQPSLHQMDLANSASTYSTYHQPLSSNQNHFNPYFNAVNDLDNAASDPRESFDAFQTQNGGNFGGHSNQKTSSGRDQSLDETKLYTDVNAGGAKSYQDYMTAGDLESKKYLSGKYGDVEDAGSGHYEGQIPVHFGFQVEHPRLQYPPKSTHHSDYHVPKSGDYHIPKSGDYHIPKSGDFHIPKSGDFHIPKSGGKIKIPKIPSKVSPSKYIPSAEDLDDEPDSDFKHIKIKKYSTNNDELPIPSTYNARYTDELPNQSRHNFKYINSVSTSSVDPHHSLEQQRSASAPEHHILPHQQLMKLAKKSPSPNQQYQQNQQQIGQQLHQLYQQNQQGQASQKYYEYVKPQMERKAGSQTPFVIYV